MREYVVPTVEEVSDNESLADTVFDNADRFPEAVSFRRKVGDGWVDVTAKEFADQVGEVARGLIASGIEPGDRVAILSRTRFEWTLVDYAIAAVGATTVPIYHSSSDEQISWILSDSGAVAVFVESEANGASVAELRDRLPALRHVWQIEPDVERLAADSASVTASQLDERRAGIRADDLSTLIYTSGTTGRPKGCEVTHRNLLAELKAATRAFPELLASDGSVLLFLPLAHVLAKIIQCGGVYSRTTIGHVADTSNLVDELASFQPTFVLSVPRVFEKVFNGAQQRAHSSGKGAIFDAAAATAEEWSRAQPSPGLPLRLRHALFDKLVYGKLRAALGGRCVAAVSGGAPLGERLGHFFRGVGLPVYEGYGLTETTAAATLNTPAAQRIGTVGRPIAGTGVRIGDDGEVLIRGDVVFRGYWHNREATEDAIADGWFHTGDLGELDDAGFLRITGRKKELIVTAAGKNVAPAALEDRLRAHPLISQCMVVGDRQPFIGALITLDPEALPGWRERHGKPVPADPADPSDVVNDPELLAEIDQAVAEANQAVSHAEAIKKYRVLTVDFTEAGGELTPTLKLKRGVVAKSYADQIDALYRDAAAGRS
ncbi:AMP-dependent synthetase/ligase [Pseudonocardia acaciae]|uniref:AMP-dependent synthetase/ligase n=1 Tax=Pseudonocardia acaciae TaxID=551276 RepID=UPI00048C0EF8|nr:AMP-dependent synthetase/ligase [Pseudonocardia acaciae]